MIGLAAVDDDAHRSAVARKRLPEKAFGCQQVTVFAEQELDRVATTVDGAVKISPLTTYHLIRLRRLKLQKLRREVNDQRCTVEWSTFRPRSAIISSTRKLRL